MLTSTQTKHHEAGPAESGAVTLAYQKLRNALKRPYSTLRYRVVPAVRHGWCNVFCYKDIRLSTMDYDEYWAGNHSAGFVGDSRTAVFARLVETGVTVAEIGCGDGHLLSILRDRRGALVKGYDISQRAVTKARERGIDAEVRDASASGLDQPFDYVIIADCLEHLPVPEQLISRLSGQFHRALLISVPNSCYWRYRLRVFFGSFMVQWVAHPGEHLRFWSISDMRWWLRQLGYNAVVSHPTWGIPVLKRVWPSMFAQNVIYIVPAPADHDSAGAPSRVSSP